MARFLVRRAGYASTRPRDSAARHDSSRKDLGAADGRRLRPSSSTMYQRYLQAFFGVLLAFGALALDGKSQAKRGKSPLMELCSDQKVYAGKYRNGFYGFSVVIPAGLKGYWNSALCAKTEEGCVCMTDHGLIIPLADSAHIEAYAGYQMESEPSAGDYEENEIAKLKKRKGVGHFKLLRSRGIQLGDVKARRFVVQFIENGKQIVSDRVAALHNDVEYQLILETSADRYEKDRREFEKVITSWRLIPRTGARAP